MTTRLPQLSCRQLAEAGRHPPEAFSLVLEWTQVNAWPGAEPGQRVVLQCHQLLRLLPGRRLVARVSIDGRQALLKLFVGAHAERYCRRELVGCEAMAGAGVATPAVYGSLAASGGGPRAGCGILFEYLAGVAPADAEDTAAVASAAAALARLHTAGWRHDDLHLENFLVRDGEVWLIDGDGIRRRRGGPSRRSSLTQLAVLAAERSPLEDAELHVLYQAYAAARGWHAAAAEGDRRLLVRLTRAERRQRVRRYMAKAQRDCTEFRCTQSWRHFFVALRQAADPALQAFAADPAPAFASADVVKAGNSATVGRLRLGLNRYIVKRYNHKNPAQALRRNLRRVPRFRLAWLNGQRLHLLGIPTARPVALLERRWGPFRGVAYLVMEDLGATDLMDDLAAHGLSQRRLDQVVALFRALAAAGLVHGDTKASNFLVHQDAVALVDLDALAPGHDGQARDVRRFLANFDEAPAFRERFEAAFRAAGLLAQ